MKKLSVIISNRNDTAMLSVTVNSCIEEFRPLGLSNCEIVIIDNSDNGIYELLPSCLPTGYMKDGLLKIGRQNFPCLFTARETAACNATGNYIVCLDSHMICGRDMLKDMYEFMENHEGKIGFGHAPINWSHHHQRSSMHDRDMSVNELGDWNRKYNNKRMITWKGMPWICNREWFLDRDKGLNGYGALRDHKVSWGGGDMHIGVKPWLLGFPNYAIPCNAGIHIGPFPKINLQKDGDVNPDVRKAAAKTDYKYRLYGASGNYPHTFGFLVSCYVLGGEPMMKRNKAALKNRFGAYIDIKKWWNKAIEIGKEEKAWLDERKIMSFEQLLERQPWNDKEVSKAA